MVRVRLMKVSRLSNDRRIREQVRLVICAVNKAERRIKNKTNLFNIKSHAIMSEEIKTNVEVPEVKEPETLEGWLKGRLDGMAAEDPVFAEKMANPKKSLGDCIKFIQGEVFHKYVEGKKHGSAAVGMPSRDEVFGLAVHYYDEDDLTIRALPAGTQVRAQAPAPTKEELEKLKKQAEENALRQFEKEAREKREAREKARRKAEAERKKEEREKKEAAAKAAGEMSLFDLYSL